eukprot:scaffold247650_cov23-Prasinocladus_malaysianus.AAC.1
MTYDTQASIAVHKSGRDLYARRLSPHGHMLIHHAYQSMALEYQTTIASDNSASFATKARVTHFTVI